MKLFAAAVLAVLCVCRVCAEDEADSREVETGVFFDDFESGQLGPVKVQGKGNYRPRALKVVRQGRTQAVLLDGGFQSRVFFSDRKFSDCVVETRISKGKGSYAGVVVRDTVLVYFQMRGALCVNSRHGKLQFQSGQSFLG